MAMSMTDAHENPSSNFRNGSGHHMPAPAIEPSLIAEEISGGPEAGYLGDEAAADEGDSHQVVTNEGSEAAHSPEPSSEAAATEYESVEGFMPPRTGAGLESAPGLAETEPVVEAYFGSTGVGEREGDQEFFAALAAIAGPALKAVFPAIVGAAAQHRGVAVANRVQQRLRALRMRQTARSPRREAAYEAGYDEAGSGTGMDHGKDAAFGEMTEAEIESAIEALDQLEVVIGRDDRVRVTATSQIPWRRICHLSIRARDNQMFLGTGFFIGPRTVMTAGHCVFLNAHGGWAREILVTPGRNADQRPFPAVRSTSFRSVRGWTQGRRRNFDYGAIILPPTSRPNVGAFGFGVFPDANLLQARVNLAGYPGDKPAGTMWYHGLKTKAVDPRVITYEIDTAGGQSGSPVWINKGGIRTVVGIHTNGSSRGNSATRIVRPVFDNMIAWRQEGR